MVISGRPAQHIKSSICSYTSSTGRHVKLCKLPFLSAAGFFDNMYLCPKLFTSNATTLIFSTGSARRQGTEKLFGMFLILPVLRPTYRYLYKIYLQYLNLKEVLMAWRLTLQRIQLALQICGLVGWLVLWHVNPCWLISY